MPEVALPSRAPDDAGLAPPLAGADEAPPEVEDASHEPRGQPEQSEQPELPLGAGNSALGLMEQLLGHPFLAPRGSASGRAASAAVVVVGLLVVAFDRRANALGDGPVTVAGLPLWQVGAGVVAAAAALWILFAFVPGRRIVVAAEHSQREEWERVGAAVRRHQRWGGLGPTLVVLGAAFGVVAYGWPGRDPDVRIAAAGALALAAGVLVAVAARSRRGVLQRLYLQTFVLAWVESAGLMGGRDGGIDPRLRRVVLEMDRLLGSLPDARMREFLSTEAGRDYLELIDELRQHAG